MLFKSWLKVIEMLFIENDNELNGYVYVIKMVLKCYWNVIEVLLKCYWNFIEILF